MVVRLLLPIVDDVTNGAGISVLTPVSGSSVTEWVRALISAVG